MIVGIDEVGRGAWAGPLVIGAVLLGGEQIDGLTDSKKLTKKQREELDLEIRRKAKSIGLGWVSAKQIDAVGLSQALRLAARRAIAHIHSEFDEIVIDGTVSFLNDERVTVMKKADLLVPSVSAASIVAKVARDNYMRHVDAIFPGYKFSSHVGYGTAAHQAAIKDIGVTPLHRLSFAPLAGYREASMPSVVTAPLQPTTKQIGDEAETVVVRYLETRGHAIKARNWRTKYCEIDIISSFNDILYFTEVKYRKSANHGDGMAAITPKKQRQMTFAAELYVARERATNSNMRLAAASVSGAPPQVEEYLELA